MKCIIIVLVYLLVFNACTSSRYRVKYNKQIEKPIIKELKQLKEKKESKNSVNSKISKEKSHTLVSNAEITKKEKKEASFPDSTLESVEMEDKKTGNKIRHSKEPEILQKSRQEKPLKESSGVTKQRDFEWRKIENNAFKVGEKLTFAIKWGIITAGYATLEVRKISKINGRKVYHIVSCARSARFFDNFYKVRDKTESFVDVESICTWRFIKELNEGKYHTKKETIYDQRNHTATIKGKTNKIPPFVQDILSALYYLRTQNIKLGEDYDIDVNTDGKNWSLEVKASKAEIIKTKAGRFKTICVEPFLKEEGIFKQKGRLWIWVTDDVKKMPVLMESKILIGSIVAVLIEVEH